jgi:DNA replication protein DnaC
MPSPDHLTDRLHQARQRRAARPVEPIPIYRCAGCHDISWTRRFVGPEDWRCEIVRCPCRQDEVKRQAWERARRASDLAAQLYSRTLDNYATTHNADAAYAVAQWSDHPAGWLTLAGAPGTGKTHLLAAAFNALVGRGHCPLYVLCPNLMDYIRDGYQSGNYGGRFWSVRQTPILLLDDLGAELRTAWSEQALFMLLDHRYAHQLPTLIATNVSLADLEPRIASRLQDITLGSVCPMTGPDYRRLAHS